jgi:hypothetical protein
MTAMTTLLPYFLAIVLVETALAGSVLAGRTDVAWNFVRPRTARFWQHLPLALLLPVPAAAVISVAADPGIAPYLIGVAFVTPVMISWIYKRGHALTERAPGIPMRRFWESLPVAALAVVPIEAVIAVVKSSVFAPYLVGAAVVAVVILFQVYLRPLTAEEVYRTDPYRHRLSTCVARGLRLLVAVEMIVFALVLAAMA